MIDCSLLYTKHDVRDILDTIIDCKIKYVFFFQFEPCGCCNRSLSPPPSVVLSLTLDRRAALLLQVYMTLTREKALPDLVIATKYSISVVPVPRYYASISNFQSMLTVSRPDL